MSGIHYVLRKNKKLAGENRYLARVRSLGTLSRDDLIDWMCKSGTTLTRADLIAAWDLIEQTALRAWLMGWNVVLPLCILYAIIRGVFESYDDRFDPNRHEIVAACRVDRRTRRMTKLEAHPVRDHPDEIHPILVSYVDEFTGLENRVITPGRTGKLQGDRLRFAKDDPRQGIFILCPDADPIRVDEVPLVEEKRLIFLIPPLPYGVYQIAVRADCGGEELDTGYLQHVLRVVPPELLLEQGDAPHGPAMPLLPE